MSQRKVDFIAEAGVAEIEAAIDWYRAQSPRSAARFIQALEAGIERIAEDPEVSPGYILGTRRYLLRRFPYLIVFRTIEQRDIQIVAVAHGRRRPGYWKNRL